MNNTFAFESAYGYVSVTPEYTELSIIADVPRPPIERRQPRERDILVNCTPEGQLQRVRGHDFGQPTSVGYNIPFSDGVAQKNTHQMYNVKQDAGLVASHKGALQDHFPEHRDRLEALVTSFSSFADGKSTKSQPILTREIPQEA